jgi:hypothetical protein
MSPDQKVLIATLWERTSAKGNTYLSGSLGKARVIGFRSEPTADGAPAWDIYLQPGKEQEERRGSEQRESLSPTSSSRTGVQRWAPNSAAERPAADDRPFYDDPIDDIGGGL